jgi:hypothetical protein
MNTEVSLLMRNVIGYMNIEGRIHYARGWDIVPEHLAKLLRHHRLRCGGTDRIAVRGGNLDGGCAGASVVAE